MDRWLWAWLAHSWNRWRTALVIVKPETVIAWRRNVSVANSQVCCKGVKSTSVLRFRGVRVSAQASLSATQKRGRQTFDTEREIREAHPHPPAHQSRRDRSVIQPPTVHLPAIRTESCATRVSARLWRASGQAGMRAVTVVIALEIEKLHLQIRGRSA